MHRTADSELHSLPPLPLKARVSLNPLGQSHYIFYSSNTEQAPGQVTEARPAAVLEGATVTTRASSRPDLPATAEDDKDVWGLPGHAVSRTIPAADASRQHQESCPCVSQQACSHQQCSRQQPHHDSLHQQEVLESCQRVLMQPAHGSLHAEHSQLQQTTGSWATALLPPGSVDDGLVDTASCHSVHNVGASSSSGPGQSIPVDAALPHAGQLTHCPSLGQQSLRVTTQQTPVTISSKGFNTMVSAGSWLATAAAEALVGKPASVPVVQGAEATTANSMSQVISADCDCVVQAPDRCTAELGVRSICSEASDAKGDAMQLKSFASTQVCTEGMCNVAADQSGRPLRVHCVTFNMGNKVPHSIPPELLGSSQGSKGSNSLSSSEVAVDLYVFATQESSSIPEWEQKICNSLPAGYMRLARQTMRAIHLVLFASSSFSQQVLSVRGSAVATGIGNLVGNKGAVALAVQLVDMKLLFISSHFAAHDDNVERRNADFARIKAGLFSSSSSYNSLEDSMSHTNSLHADHDDSPCGIASLQQSRLRPECPGGTTGSWCSTALHSAAGQQQPLVSHQAKAGSLAGGSAVANRISSPRGWRLGAWSRWSASVSPLSSDAATGLATTSHAVMSLPGDLMKLSAVQQPIAGFQETVHSVGNALAGASSCSLRVCANDRQQVYHGRFPPLSGGSIHATSPSISTYDGQCSPQQLAIPNIPDFPCVWLTTVPAATALEHKSSSLLSTQSILNQSTFNTSPGTSSPLHTMSDGIEDYDIVFWLGDLNYRINGNTRSVGYLMRSKLHEVLHANDQLRLQQRKGRVFQGFQEGRIAFAPTFKFVPGTSEYSSLRVPSWTDRILWKIRRKEAAYDSPVATVTQHYYHSVPEVTCSDHKPVVARFDLATAPAQVLSVQANSKDGGRRCNIM